MTARKEEVSSEEKKPKKGSTTKKKRKKTNTFSLVKKSKEKQREISKEAVEYYQKELDKWTEKLEEFNKELKDDDWKKLTANFTYEEMMERMQQQGK